MALVLFRVEAACRPITSRAERLAWRLALGFGAMGSLGLAGAAAGILTRSVCWVVIVPCALVGVAQLRREVSSLAAIRSTRATPGDIAGALVFCGLAGMLLLLAWNPLLLIDSYAYHITLPKQYSIQGRLFETPYALAPNFHFLGDMTGYWGLAIAPWNFIPPKVFQVCCCIAMAAVMVTELRRAGRPGLGWIVGGLWLSAREIIEFAPSAHVDLSMAMFVFLGAVVAAKSFLLGHRYRPRCLFLAGIFLGCACGTKISGLPVSFLAGLVVVGFLLLGWKQCRARFPIRITYPLREAVAFAVGIWIPVIPWIAKSLYLTNNPFFPFALDWFHTAPAYQMVAADFLASYGGFAGPTLLGFDWWMDLANRTILILRTSYYLDTYRFTSGFLVGVLLWTWGRRRRRRDMQFLVALGIAWFPLSVLSPAWRFALGMTGVHLLVGAVCIGLSIPGNFPKRLPRWHSLLLAAILVSFGAWHIPHMAERIHPHYVSRGPIPWGLYLNRSDFEAYWRTRADWPIIDALDEVKLQKGGRVLVTEPVYPIAATETPLLPLLNIHGKNVLRIITEEPGETADSLKAWLANQRVEAILTEDATFSNEQLLLFRNQHLREVARQGALALYLMNP